ncbi:MAG: DJ-1/PfpI family protein [Candidatus Bipolaricaulota bacterium]
MRRRTVRNAILICGLLAVSLLTAASDDPISVLVILPPLHAVAGEFFPLLRELEAAGLRVDVAAWETGPYLFWEDSYAGGDDDNEPDRYVLDVATTYEAAAAGDYDALILGPGHAHGSWNIDQGRETAIALIAEAMATDRLLGAVTFGVVFLLDSGLMDGRSVCAPPHYKGIVDLTLHIANFLSAFDVTFAKDCVHVDETVSPVVVTGGHRCVHAFALAFAARAAELLGD